MNKQQYKKQQKLTLELEGILKKLKIK